MFFISYAAAMEPKINYHLRAAITYCTKMFVTYCIALIKVITYQLCHNTL